MTIDDAVEAGEMLILASHLLLRIVDDRARTVCGDATSRRTGFARSTSAANRPGDFVALLQGLGRLADPSDVGGPTLAIVCEPSCRRGRYNGDRLIAEHGDAKLTDLLATLADCAKARSGSVHDLRKERPTHPAAETWSMKSRMCRSISSPGRP